MTAVRPSSTTRPSSGEFTSELYGYAVLGLAFLIVSLFYVGQSAWLYSDPSDGVSKQNSTMISGRFHFRRVDDSGRPESEVLRYIVETKTGDAVSMEQGMVRLSGDAVESMQMAQDLSKIISDSPYDGVFFETPGVDATSVSTTPMEFVLVNAPQLARFAESRPDEAAFAEHLDSCSRRKQTVCSFDNLGGDARLVAPRKTPIGAKDAKVYSHLASFVRGATEYQIADLWRLAASEYVRSVHSDKTWLSTNGMGVAWLHVRLDSHPKYYQYAPFKD